jgi:hypothetical protein
VDVPLRHSAGNRRRKEKIQVPAKKRAKITSVVGLVFFFLPFGSAEMYNFFGVDISFRVPPLMPHYLGELMVLQVKRKFCPILLSMWVMVMLPIMSLCASVA